MKQENTLQNLRKKQVHLEFNGNQGVIIEEFDGILEYNERQVRISCQNQVLRFQGSDLQLCTMTQESMMLSGTIKHVDFIG